MISSIQGIIQILEKDSAVIEVGGVGIEIFIPAPVRDRLRIGEAAFLFTRLIVREDSLTLYGFDTKESREYFDLLIGVNGIGPRMGLNILSSLSPESIRRAIFNEQPELFSRVPGIGKKTAQKILISLQDRLPAGEGLAAVTAISDVDMEIIAALTSLGYSVVEAQAALQSIPKDAPLDVETRLRLALQYFTHP
jgi:Holliday junction DNA helicase RuvA